MDDVKGASLSDWNDYVFLAEDEESAFSIRHTLILPESYWEEDLEIKLSPENIEDEIKFDHLKEVRRGRKRINPDL